MEITGAAGTLSGVACTYGGSAPRRTKITDERTDPVIIDTPSLAECQYDEALLAMSDSERELFERGVTDCPLEDCGHVHDPEDGPCLVVVEDWDGTERPCGCTGPCPSCKGSGFTTRREYDRTDDEWIKVHDDCTACDGSGRNRR